jgi:hypothetical protein
LVTRAKPGAIGLCFNLSRRAEKTFDDEHPCRICKTVDEGLKSEQKQTTIKVETKLELCLARERVALP